VARVVLAGAAEWSETTTEAAAGTHWQHPFGRSATPGGRNGVKPEEQDVMPKSTKAPDPRKLPQEHWKEQPDDHDYPAATDYLTLLVSEDTAGALVERLRKGAVMHRKAKDLLRASRLPLLSLDNAHVRQDLDKVQRGQLLSPVLLVCGSLSDDVPLTVADDYQRICASYTIDEDADIPCRLVAPGAH
jgi:hypothetical protein